MSDDDGIFYFKFSSLNGLEQVLEQGSWLIRNIPLILTKWTPNLSLSKDKETTVLVWVKLHKVTVVAYSEDGLSLIATQIGNPIMLDAFTSTMCVEAWGRIGYARALIKVSADKDLKQEVTMVVPNIVGNEVSHTFETIRVEYEWKPPLCLDCHVFGHANDTCPKRVPVKVTSIVEVDNDGFTTVTNRKSKGKGPVNNQKKNITGFRRKSRMIIKNPKGQAVLVMRFPMISIAAWNVRGLNCSPKQSEACVNKIEVMDINSTSLHYTWNQKPRSGGGVLKKLDRIMEFQVSANDFELNPVTPVTTWTFNGSTTWFYTPEPKITNKSNNHQFLGTDMECDDRISMDISLNMVQNVTNEEIKAAMFDIGDDRAPGPDGFTSAFFKKSWDIVGNDVCNAVCEFFINCQLLKEINHTFLALIPKVSTPFKVTDYRPISCCNVLYKCISKILTNRIIDGLKEVVSENQSAFIPGRRISDNILITQELMHNYHRNRCPPRCAFKVDIQKAYDTVDWKFLASIMKYFGFHNKMVKWIMACVTSASFSLCINGDIHGFFKRKRGLRQGDPISPYLFTMVMEVLTLIIKRMVRVSDTFRYHNRCEELQLVNMC
ncbi:aspartic peptidase, partial [Tanacetum coccineum]